MIIKIFYDDRDLHKKTIRKIEFHVSCYLKKNNLHACFLNFLLNNLNVYNSIDIKCYSNTLNVKFKNLNLI